MNRKSKMWICAALLAVVCMTASAQTPHPSTQPAAAQTTQPAPLIEINFSSSDAGELCFQGREYELALNFFKVAVAKTRDPAQRAALQKRIGECEKLIASRVPTAPDKRIPHKLPPAGTTLDISLEELGNFDYDADKGGGIPADVKALNGSKVRVHGYMVPMDEAEHIREFALVPYVFGGDVGPRAPPMQNTIVVNCPRPVDYSEGEIVVEGKLNVEEKREGGFIVSVFQIADADVRPVPKSK